MLQRTQAEIDKSPLSFAADLSPVSWLLARPPTCSQHLNTIAQQQIANKLQLLGRYKLNKHLSSFTPVICVKHCCTALNWAQ